MVCRRPREINCPRSDTEISSETLGLPAGFPDSQIMNPPIDSNSRGSLRIGLRTSRKPDNQSDDFEKVQLVDFQNAKLKGAKDKYRPFGAMPYSILQERNDLEVNKDSF